jgi:INO80 complex subunit C
MHYPITYVIITCKLFLIDQGIEAGPSLQPRRKYCDITGFETNYIDPRSGLRYYNSEIYKIIQNLSEPIKNQYLSLRKALFIIK